MPGPAVRDIGIQACRGGVATCKGDAAVTQSVWVMSAQPRFVRRSAATRQRLLHAEGATTDVLAPSTASTRTSVHPSRPSPTRWQETATTLRARTESSSEYGGQGALRRSFFATQAMGQFGARWRAHFPGSGPSPTTTGFCSTRASGTSRFIIEPRLKGKAERSAASKSDQFH